MTATVAEIATLWSAAVQDGEYVRDCDLVDLYRVHDADTGLVRIYNARTGRNTSLAECHAFVPRLSGDDPAAIRKAMLERLERGPVYRLDYDRACKTRILGGFNPTPALNLAELRATEPLYVPNGHDLNFSFKFADHPASMPDYAVRAEGITRVDMVAPEYTGNRSTFVISVGPDQEHRPPVRHLVQLVGGRRHELIAMSQRGPGQ